MASRAEHYRELARECLEVAATLPDGKLRDSMLQMAETWERLAQEQQNATDLRQRQE
jgi:chromosome segregation ATPase